MISKLENAFLSGDIVKYHVEWCAVERTRARGVAFKDCCLLFENSEHESGKINYVRKDPKHNVYVYIPHPLCDPVEETASQRVSKFYKQTYVKNELALLTQFDAECLAIEGDNIDRLFLTWGPGLGPAIISNVIRLQHHEKCRPRCAMFDVW